MQPSGLRSAVITTVPPSDTWPPSTPPVKATSPSVAVTGPPPHGYSMVPVLPACTGKSTQPGDDGTEPVTSKVGPQSPDSQSASTMPSQSSSTPLHVSSVSSPRVQPPQTTTSSVQTSESGPSQASPRWKPSSVVPSQSSSIALHASATGPIAPVHSPKSPSTHSRIPGVHAPTSLPHGATSPSSQGMGSSSSPASTPET